MARIAPHGESKGAALDDFPRAHEIGDVVVEAEFFAEEFGVGGEIDVEQLAADVGQAGEFEVGPDAGQVGRGEEQALLRGRAGRVRAAGLCCAEWPAGEWEGGSDDGGSFEEGATGGHGRRGEFGREEAR